MTFFFFFTHNHSLSTSLVLFITSLQLPSQQKYAQGDELGFAATRLSLG